MLTNVLLLWQRYRDKDFTTIADQKRDLEMSLTLLKTIGNYKWL